MNIAPADLGFPGTVGAAWSELALRFTLSVADVTTAIVGTTQPTNVERNLEVAARGALPDKVIADLRDAFRRAESEAGETWLAQT
jgi:aryl-alcohol dehydrogenase-like predicted oxidoreductase